MIAVLDASAAFEILFNRPRQDSISAVLKEAESVLAPGLYVPEVTNVVWKYFRDKQVDKKGCSYLLKHALSLPDEFVPDLELHDEAFSAACEGKSTAYDMFYFVLARAHDAILLTCDKELEKYARKNSVKLP